MSQSAGPFTDRYGLVFGYDMSENINCYKGEPTTNIAYATSNNLTSNSNWWFNSGESILLNNDTSLTKPIIPNVDTTNLHIFSSQVTIVGNQHLGSAIIPVSPNTQYTMSIYFWFQGSTMQTQPYLRTAVNNTFVVAFDYNGDTNYLNWPRGKWIRLSATYTTPGNETGLYMTSYTGDFVGEKVAYFGYQLEQKDHMTPLVLGTRSGTQGLIDFTNNKTVNISTTSFNSSGNIIYDGTNDYASLNSAVLSAGQSIYTIEAVFKPYSTKTQVVWEQNSAGVTQNQRACMILLSNGYGGFNGQANDYHSVIPYTPNTWYHWVIVVDKNDANYPIKLYNNGSLYSQGIPTNGGTNLNVGTHGAAIGYKLNANDEYFHGEIPIVRIYNRLLTSSEVSVNYNNYKKRFGI